MVQKILGKFRKTLVRKSLFKKDHWLSAALNKNTFKLSNFSDINEKSLLKSFNDIRKEYLNDDLFIFVKVRTNLVSQINKIENLGFRLIDTNILFTGNSELRHKEHRKDNIYIKFSENSHKSFVGDIAYNNFVFSRFHLDPKIKKSQADSLKKSWVENFFSGKRGDYMIIALFNDKPVGFLQLIEKGNILIIDLIAVKLGYRGKNIGSSMINFAYKNIQFEKIIVGTQISNLPSIRLYQNLGFIPISSDYVFHFHNN